MPSGGGSITCIIANGATASGPVDLNGFKCEAILLPTLTSGTLAIEGSLDGTNFYPVKDVTPTQVCITGATTGGYFLDADVVAKTHGIRYLRFVSGASQGADRTITVYLSRL